MQCMEVWGGNQVVDNSVSMSGLDAWVYSRPFHDEEDGGDVYYVSSRATGRITRLLVADVSGHGAAVGKIAIELRTLMRQFVNRIDQTSFVASMNEQFTALSEAGCFATAIVTTFFAPTNRLTLCNAGHPSPLIYRVTSRTWGVLEARDDTGLLANLPLGIDDDDHGYEELSRTLDVGDLVLCYTDALPEARNAAGDMLGADGLLAIARELDASQPEKLIPALVDRVARFQGELPVQDDVTLLLFRPNGLAPRVPLRDKVLAPFRILKGIAHSLVTHKPMPLPDLSVPSIGGAMIDSLSRVGSVKKHD